MITDRRWRLIAALLLAAPFTAPAAAQQSPSSTGQAAPASGSTATPTVKPAAKPKPKPKPAANAAPAPAPKPEPHAPPKAVAAVAGGAQPRLLGQYGEWGAYTASPGGKKVCFAIAKPTASQTSPPGRPRNPPYMFVSTRPADKVANEVSIIIGYPFKPSSEASAEIGTSSFALYTQQDGAWIKNAAEEAQMVDAMKAGQSAIVKGVSAKGTQSTDTFSLKGLTQALDRTSQECK